MMPTIGIIGGNGRMGSALARFFERMNHKVLISDIKASLSNKKVVQIAHVVIVSVPINRTVEAIEAIAPYLKSDQLIMDVTSIKEKPVNAMLKTKASVIGLHPMCNETTFGPGQNLLYCPGRPGKWSAWFKTLFETQGQFKLIKLTPKKHDKMMGIVQSLIHFNEFVLGKTLKVLHPKLEDLLSVASTASRLKINIAARHLAQDSNLYGNIQIQNPYNRKVLKTFLAASEELYEIINAEDLKRFIHYFNEGRDFFGKYAEQAFKETDTMIQSMVAKPKPAEPSKWPKAAIGTLGPVLTYTSMAAEQWRGKTKNQILYLRTIDEVFDAVEKGKIQYGVVPLENRLHGTVRETHDNLFQKKVWIIAELTLPIHHCLAILPNAHFKKIQRIFSHPQALNQSKDYIKKHFGQADWVDTTSTAAAFEHVKDTGDIHAAVVGSVEAAEHFKFKMVDRHIENNHDNFTHFIVITKEKPAKCRGKKTSIVFYFNENEPGSLAKVFNCFAERKINLSRIESRPAPKSLGEYLFFADFEENIKTPLGKALMHQLQKVVSGVKVLGVY